MPSQNANFSLILYLSIPTTSLPPKSEAAMEDDTQRVLRPQPPKRGRKRQIIQSSPEAGEQVAEVVSIPKPKVLKKSEPNKTITPLQPAFQPPTDAFNFSLPVHTTSESASILPGYAKIIVDEPPEIRQHANPNYRVIFHAAALVEETLKAIPEGTDAEGQVYSKEARQAREALEEARKILFQVVSGERPEKKLIRSFIDASTSTTNEPGSLDDRMHSPKCKLDTLLSKPSYAAALQHPPHPVSSLPAVPVTAPAAKAVSLEETRFVVEVESPVPGNFNPLLLQD